ncbi:GHMP kinase [Blastocladiella britannica]|nr:GHMP kinase [Blastocladiella britannica]
MTTPTTALVAIEATATAPVNIAVIKYWGKRDEALILPTNSSLSLTLSQDVLHAKTSARAATAFTTARDTAALATAAAESSVVGVFPSDTLWLNGVAEPVSGSKRLAAVVTAMRAHRRALEEASGDAEPRIADWPLHIVSENNFPTAAGLASSAAGYAALVAVLAHLYGLPGTHHTLDTDAQRAGRAVLSSVARLGSGSACRSLYGGYVAWNMGTRADGADSVAELVAAESHWPEIEALVLVVHDGKKGVSSTSGMQTTVLTSPLAQYRFEHVVPARMRAMRKAIASRDFDAFAELTMKDSNQFHAVALDTFPPITYLNDVSRAIIQLVTDYNATPTAGYSGKYKVAYTYDAGPNAVLYVPREFVPEVLALVHHYLPHAASTASTESAATTEYFTNPYGITVPATAPKINSRLPVQPEGSIKRILHAKIGDGPRFLYRGVPGEPAAVAVSLINAEGRPIREVAGSDAATADD